MQKVYVIGDIHGGYKPMMEVFKKSKFDYENDKLILLGDVCDRLPQTFEVIEELLKIKNLVFVRGNHDQWFIDYIFGTGSTMGWFMNGGQKTIDSYTRDDIEDIPVEHAKFLDSSIPYYEMEKMLFVHGGFDVDIPIEDHGKDHLMWDRSLTRIAYNKKVFLDKENLTDKYEKIFIGHTPTLGFDEINPIHAAGIINMDTGVCYGGMLSMMNVHTKETFQSNFSYKHYDLDVNRVEDLYF